MLRFWISLRAATPITVGPVVQLMPALSVSLAQLVGPLFAPGLAVVVLQHQGNANASLLCSDQRLGNSRKTEFLQGDQYLLGGTIKGFNQPCLHVVTNCATLL